MSGQDFDTVLVAKVVAIAGGAVGGREGTQNKKW
jgi:hypothetical protein